MATILPKDDQIVTLGQKTGRFFVSGPGLVSIRKDDVPHPFISLGVKKESVCGEDKRYGRNPLPRRSAWGFEPDARKPWLGLPREVNFDLIVSKGEPLATHRYLRMPDGSYTETNLPAYFTIFQWMGLPLPGTSAVPTAPQALIDLAQVGGGLCLVFKVHTDLIPGKKEPVPWRAIQAAPPAPIPRDASLSIKAQFQDGFGKDGWFKVWLRGKLVCDYVGPTGFVNHGNLFGAIQAYTSESPIETRLRFGNLSEGPIGAVETTW